MRERHPGTLPPGQTDERTLLDYAWMVELKHRLEEHCADDVVEPSLSFRVVAHDRGISWEGSWTEVVPEHAGGIYIDIAQASARQHARW